MGRLTLSSSFPFTLAKFTPDKINSSSVFIFSSLLTSSSNMLTKVLQQNHQNQSRKAKMGIAERMLTQEFVDDIVRGMQAWDVKGCAIIVVPMKPGMGPPGGKFFGEREKGKKMTANVSGSLIHSILSHAEETDVFPTRFNLEAHHCTCSPPCSHPTWTVIPDQDCRHISRAA